MKTVLSTLTSLILFVLFFLGATFLMETFAFRGPRGEEGLFTDYLQIGAAWFIAPGIAAYYAPKAANGLISGSACNTMVVSYISVLCTVFIALFVFALVAPREVSGFSTWTFVAYILQFGSILVGSYIVKNELSPSTA